MILKRYKEDGVIFQRKIEMPRKEAEENPRFKRERHIPKKIKPTETQIEMQNNGWICAYNEHPFYSVYYMPVNCWQMNAF